MLAPWVRCIFLLVSLLPLSGCSLLSFSAGEEDTPGDAVYYVVKPGDTISAIATRFRVPADKLAELNGVTDPRKLAIGTKLLIGHRKLYPDNLKRAKLSDERRAKGRFLWPVDGGHVVSRFGPRGDSFHDGLDIAAPEGTAVFAAHAGVIAFAGDKLSGYGKLLILRGDDGVMSVYAHNSRLLVNEGERVKKGEQLSEVGQTGRAEGPHLHFELRLRDQEGRYVAVDPTPLLENSGVRPRYRVNERLTPLLARLFGFGKSK